MALKECFRAYRQAQLTRNIRGKVKGDHGTFIPFHASSLTHLLRECFSSSNHKTILIATVSPTATDVEHTRETLEHATYLMDLRRSEQQSFEVDVLDVQTSIRKDDIPMIEWSNKHTCEWIRKVVPKEYLSKLILDRNLDGKVIKRMGRSQVTFRVCGGDRDLGRLLFKRIRTELKKLNEIDRKNRMLKARRETKGNGIGESKKRPLESQPVTAFRGRPPNETNGIRGGLHWVRRYRMAKDQKDESESKR